MYRDRERVIVFTFFQAMYVCCFSASPAGDPPGGLFLFFIPSRHSIYEKLAHVEGSKKTSILDDDDDAQ